MYSTEQKELSLYRLSKAEAYLKDAQTTLKMGLYDTAANRSYYAVFHAMRALLALEGKDFKKHSGVISYFQKAYIKSGIFEKRFSDIVKSAFSLRQESDYEDFYVISKEEVIDQVDEADVFLKEIRQYIDRCVRSKPD